MNTNKVTFSPMREGEEARYTHVVSPDGSMRNDHCRGCVFDVSIGVVTPRGAITRPQLRTIRRMEGMALLLSPTCSFEYRGDLAEAMDAIEDMRPMVVHSQVQMELV